MAGLGRVVCLLVEEGNKHTWGLKLINSARSEPTAFIFSFLARVLSSVSEEKLINV